MAYAWNPKMGPPKNYDEWVSYHQQSGTFNANDQQRRDAYHAYALKHGLPTPWVKPATPATPAAPSTETTPNFNYLDAQGIADMAAAQQRYDSAMGFGGMPGSLADQRTQQLADIQAARLNSELGYSDAMRASSRNASSRGMFNSGLRRFRDARNLANLNQALSGYALRQTGVENDFRRGSAAAEAAWAQDKAAINAAAGTRNMDLYYKSRGLS